jgi:hypothetical protein
MHGADIPSQVNNFIKRVKATPGIDYDNDWKVRCCALLLVMVKKTTMTTKTLTLGRVSRRCCRS